MASPKQGVRSKLRAPLLGSRRGKEPNKFQFDIVIDRIIGGGSAEYSLKWSRGVKTATTKKFMADPRNKDGVTLGQKLSLLSTLYRTKAQEGVSFEPKDSKLSLISQKEGRKTAKTVGKVHFNLADYVGIPCATSTASFTLNGKTKVDVTITCTFVRVSRGTASSMGSGLSGMTASSGEVDDGNDDFADLDLALSPVSALLDVPEPEPESPPAPLATKRSSDTPGSHAATPEPGRLKKALSPRMKGRTEPDGENRSPRASGILTTFKSKARVTALENEMEDLNLKLEETLRENDKNRVLIQISEDVIRELREKIDGQANGSSSTRGVDPERDALIERLQKDLATCALEKQQQERSFDSRLNLLRQQVETTERTNARLEREKKTLEGQMSSLSEGVADEKKEQGERETKARQKLIFELSQLQSSNDELRSALEEKTGLAEEIKSSSASVAAENKHLSAKLIAHEEHAAKVKGTYDSLSAMYNKLRDEHSKMLRTQGSGSSSRKLISKDSSSSVGAHDGADGNTATRTNSEMLQDVKQQLLDSERVVLEERKKAVHYRGQAEKEKTRADELSRSVETLSDRVDGIKAKAMSVAEELDVSTENYEKSKTEADELRNRNDNLTRKLTVAQKLQNDAGSDDNDDDNAINPFEAQARIVELEEALVDATDREDKYEQEILKLTAIVDGLANKVSTRDLLAGKRDGSAGGGEGAEGAKERSSGNGQGSATDDRQSRHGRGQESSDADAMKSRSSLRKRISKRPGSKTNEFISSSEVRQVDLFEKITDGRLLNMLVETKMKLAIAEEEKLALEHLIRKVREGDKHIQDKLSEHASRLEVKLNQATVLLSNIKRENSGDLGQGSTEAAGKKPSSDVSSEDKHATGNKTRGSRTSDAGGSTRRRPVDREESNDASEGDSEESDGSDSD